VFIVVRDAILINLMFKYLSSQIQLIMNVAQVCPRFYPHIGGVETHVYEISKRLAKQFNVEIITTDPSGKLAKTEEIEGIIIRRFKSFAPADAYYFSLDLYQYLKRHSLDYDVIHAHNYHAFPALFAALAKCRNKLVFTPHYHGKGHSFVRNVFHKPYKIIGNIIFEKAEAIICVSNFERKLILRNFRLNTSRIFVIPNGIDLDEFRSIDINKIKKQKDKTLKNILYVGRIEKYKGVDYIVKALKYLPENYVLEIVGKGTYKQKIIKIAKKLGVIHRIRFFQDLCRSKLIEKYVKADVLVLLSRFEAYGLVVAEALACKTPCIVANTSALREWIDNKSVFGIDVPINIEKLAKLIIKASNIEIKIRQSITGWDDVYAKLYHVYSEI